MILFHDICTEFELKFTNMPLFDAGPKELSNSGQIEIVQYAGLVK